MNERDGVKRDHWGRHRFASPALARTMVVLLLLLALIVPSARSRGAASSTSSASGPTSAPAVLGSSAPTARAPAKDPLTSLPSYGEMLRRTAYTLFAIIAVLLLTAKLLPRWLGKSRFMTKGKLIEVIEFQRIEPRKGIYLLRVAGQYLLVGSSGDRLETLAGGPLDQEKLAVALSPAAGKTGTPANASTDKSTDTPPALYPAPRQFIEVLRGKRGDAEIG